MFIALKQSELAHHGILGQKWGVRRFQNEDGSLTTAGKERYDRQKPTPGSRAVRKISKTPALEVHVDKSRSYSFNYDLDGQDLCNKMTEVLTKARDGTLSSHSGLSNEIYPVKNVDSNGHESYWYGPRPDSEVDYSGIGRDHVFNSLAEAAKSEYATGLVGIRTDPNDPNNWYKVSDSVTGIDQYYWLDYTIVKDPRAQYAAQKEQQNVDDLLKKRQEIVNSKKERDRVNDLLAKRQEKVNEYYSKKTDDSVFNKIKRMVGSILSGLKR